MNYKPMARIIIILTACLSAVAALTSHGIAQSSKQQVPALFYKANELFQQGDYDKAAKAYQEILSAGAHSGNIYYNLGNAFFKQGRLGKAIVNYQRAKRLLPHDSDVQANLNYALSLCNNSVIPSKRLWLMSLISSITEQLTLDSWTVVLFGVYTLVLVFFAWFVMTRIVFVKKTAVFLLSCLVLTGGLWFVKYQQTMLDKQAIIVVSEVDSRFAPAEDAVVHFKVYEGAGIEIIDQNDHWFRIKTPDGKIGWVLKTAAEKI